MDKHCNENQENTARNNMTVELEESCVDNKEGSGDGKEAKDIAYRHRLLHTSCVWISMFALGWRNAMIGPTFPDLRIIIDEDLSTSSWIFTAKSLGGLIGSVFGGLAYDRFNKIGMFILFVWGMGVAAGMTPWCYNFVAMLIAHVLHGIFAAAVDTAATADVTVVWKHKSGPYMQAVHSAFSVAGIISPLVTEPFLAEKVTAFIRFNATNVSTISLPDSNNLSSASVAPYNLSTVPDKMANNTLTEYGETFVYIPYSVTAAICLVSGLLYLVVCFVYGNVYNRSVHQESVDVTQTTQEHYFLSQKMKVIFTIFLGLTMVFYVLSENCFIGFLMTFVISELNWSKAKGSTASSLFWITFSVGRISGIIIVKCINLSAVIFAFFGIMISSSVLFLIAVVLDVDILVWLSVGISGFGMSVIFASVFSWLSKHIRKLTGKITSVIFVFMTSGNMVIPILVGNLMDKISLMWYIYSQLILISAMCICFTFVFVYFNVLKKMHGKSEVERRAEQITS
ncbi:sodium-dependent glucose transporter 1A-like [Mercenaria mercenaria]|uniref:sodium-dependent glucose transporter 1A-like n=1 Tax=Mercenaria mercenaria TaxID=6596 RepID=UPI001E1DEF9F|nr:sodium-dependent glucose transporter 1A-like [Mercenaria mercenaria]XP_045201861.1 sodium-dependent glucose transporter 1A-like [Mercenaria mercenaria]